MIVHEKRSCLAAGALLSLLAIVACDERTAEPPPPLVPAEHPEFHVSWRCEEPLALKWSLEGTPPPSLDKTEVRATLERAVGIWSETGIVRFAPAENSRAADVVVSFQSSNHPDFAPAATIGSIAITGRRESRAFILLARDTAWSLEGEEPGTTSLFQALAHEFGHVLGLDHTTDPASVLYPDADPRRTKLVASDLCGLHSLYGGGEDHVDDLVIRRPSGERERLCVLRRVAREDVTDVAAFDTDGDGRDELLVWRTDESGQGNLMVYRFGPGPKLEKSVGPLRGIAAPGARLVLGREGDGRRFAARVFENGRLSVLVFDDNGLPTPRPQDPFEGAGILDRDGDGQAEQVPDAPTARAILARGDFDGDGADEVVARPDLDAVRGSNDE